MSDPIDDVKDIIDGLENETCCGHLCHVETRYETEEWEGVIEAYELRTVTCKVCKESFSNDERRN